MLNQSYYDWFNKIERGIHEVSNKEKEALPKWLIKMEKIT